MALERHDEYYKLTTNTFSFHSNKLKVHVYISIINKFRNLMKKKTKKRSIWLKTQKPWLFSLLRRANPLLIPKALHRKVPQDLSQGRIPTFLPKVQNRESPPQPKFIPWSQVKKKRKRKVRKKEELVINSD